jgi:hypothetical protein
MNATFTDHAPAYWEDSGGAHWIAQVPSGALVSAVRSASDQVWTVFDCSGASEEVAKELTEEDIKRLLGNMLHEALTRDLKGDAEHICPKCCHPLRLVEVVPAEDEDKAICTCDACDCLVTITTLK